MADNVDPSTWLRMMLIADGLDSSASHVFTVTVFSALVCVLRAAGYRLGV
ncbi:hypothetical protein [Candidatus Lucifugimonas marina]|uniref:Uncharacterized protein n=1 Tax=Candidatus Lucifugimonas marina TaxID=3038979 RepID=A0AAJ6CU27_9CHLR|nr:hypothetical protein [SAR202 cluster bacterium JH702]WFG34824.1 hypothetical protein GKN94_03705 [SAR202 cluster bacterium JH545]WFG38764.1 hypothetical protein GKO48_03785 [SAR202 cluster bacterium JH1073]